MSKDTTSDFSSPEPLVVSLADRFAAAGYCLESVWDGEDDDQPREDERGLPSE